MSNFQTLVEEYAQGAELLQQAVQGMTDEQVRARPIPGKWSTLEVVAHLADFEPVFMDRMKRVIALDRPEYPSTEENAFAAHLVYDKRDIAQELALASAVRNHMATILRVLPDATFTREGVHSAMGVQTLEKILWYVTNHIKHHLPFIAEKRKALGC